MPKTFKEILAASSLGQGLANIKRNGVAAELRELEREMRRPNAMPARPGRLRTRRGRQT